MRRAVLASTVTAAGVVLLLSLKPHGSPSTQAAPVIGSDPGGTAAVPTAPDSPGGSPSPPSAGPTTPGSPGASPSPPAAGPTTAAGTRVVTGNAIDTRYGPVQVRITFSGSRITRAEVLQYPSESRRDLEINRFALPQLNQETISAQSARIDAVAGATYTSQGYQRSLQSALDQARP
ncbi:FMN-binding protein [Kitasatospora sp. NPDC047058]|uniref:FMN-binding protein n=1 Tax=Kitasatospora sp. NPDC047058 TaxID=3155620 RepID=UPI0033F96EFE